MTTTDQVEAALKAMDGATFQRLCDAYMRLQGFDSYLSIGLAVGKVKTRTGTPDSIASSSDGHTFVEVTTVNDEALPAKLLGDLDACLSPVRTGVPLDKIRSVRLFFTGHLEAAAVEALHARVRPHDIMLVLTGPHALAGDLRYRFASLAWEYLQLAIDTGQVVDPETFVHRPTSGGIQTDLDADFVAREVEVSVVLSHLTDGRSHPAVLLTGKGGVGKTRLALEAIRRARQRLHPATVLCVRSRSLDATTDLRTALERPGQYLVLFDDANRMTNLAALLDIALEVVPGRDVRVLLTVRDHVASAVESLLEERGQVERVPISRLGDDALRLLLEGSFEIRNHHFQTRILALAVGNARLAVMAARLAVDAPALSELRDATDIYRRFFAPLERDCPLLRTAEALRVLGVIALVGHLDLSEPSQVNALATLHRLDADRFRAIAQNLDDVELVDLHESGVVRIGDQTLASYVLFRAVFEERVVDLEEVLSVVYPLSGGALLEALNGIGAAFSSDNVVAQMRRAVDGTWDGVRLSWPEELQDSFVLAFAAFRPADALAYSLLRLEAATPEAPSPAGPGMAKISFQDNVGDTPTLLLGRYREDMALRGVALDGLIAEARRRPSRMGVLLRLAWEQYGFSTETNWETLGAEQALVERMWLAAREDELVAAPMFIAIAGRALRTEHDSASSGRGHSIVFSRFHLPHSGAVRRFRDLLWQRLCAQLVVPSLRAAVLGTVTEFAQGGVTVQERAIVAADLSVLEPMLLPLLDPEVVPDWIVVRNLRNLRARFGLGLPPAYARFVATPGARLATLLLRDPIEDRVRGWKAAMAMRAGRLQRFAEQADATRIAGLGPELERLAQCYGGHDAYVLEQGISALLTAAASSQSDATLTLLRGWIKADNPLRLAPAPLLDALNKSVGLDTTWQLVTTTAPSPVRDPWLLSWLQLLPRSQWTRDHAALVASLLRTTATANLVRSRELVEHAMAVDPGSGDNLLVDLIQRIAEDPQLARVWAFEFHSGTVLETALGKVLLAHPELFQRMYLALQMAERYIDPHATVLDALLRVKPSFGSVWLSQMLKGTRRPSFDDTREYSILWRREDWSSLMEELAVQILESDHDTIFGESFLSNLLRLPEGLLDREVLEARQDGLLDRLARQKASDEEGCRRLFEAVAHLPAERRKRLIGVYLSLNPSPEMFARLPVEPRTWGWSGSEVPLLRKRRVFLESLLPLCNRAELLGHRTMIEQWLRSLDKDILRAQRTDFVESRDA